MVETYINSNKIGEDTYNTLINNIDQLPLGEESTSEESTSTLADINSPLDEISYTDTEGSVLVPVGIPMNIPVPPSKQPVLTLLPKPQEPVPALLPKLPVRALSPKNYTLITPPELVTKLIRRNSINMKGGADLDELKIQMSLINSNDNLLAQIMEYLYERDKTILDGDYIINILISILYNEFIDSDNELSDIITPEYFKTIPEMYTFNFKHKVMGDLEQKIPNFKIKLSTLNENVALIKNMYLNSMPENNLISKSNNLQQSGGKSHKRIDRSDDKTVEEKIQKNIESISTYLKSKEYKKQTGGNLTPADMLQDIKNFPPNPTKEQKRDILEKSNMWVVELLEQNLANKIIKDSEYNIARYYLVAKNPEPNLNQVITIVNNNASILTLKDDDRVKIDLPNKITIEKLGNAQRGNITDKLKEYFNKKYQKLLELREQAYNKQYLKQQEPIDAVGKLKIILAQYGGMDSNILKDECFTSKQYTKFLEKLGSYMRNNRQTIDEISITNIQDDIKKLVEIEEKLIQNNTLFDNYKKIQDVYPDKIYKSISIPSHLDKVYNENMGLFDNYGTVNIRIIDLIKNLEKYKEVKEAINSKEINSLSQLGGGKSYMKFNNFNDVEHFTTRTFQKILEEMKEEDNQ